MHRPRGRHQIGRAPLLATAIGGAAGFAALSTLVSRRKTRRFDGALRERIGTGHGNTSKKVVAALGYSGKSWVHGPAAAHVLWREGMADARIAFPLAALIPALEGAGRLYLDRHWTTDVIAGVLGGVTIAAVCALGYEAKA
jgi:hypothetical protein